MSNEMQIKLELTIPQVNVVLSSLKKQPWEIVADTISTIEQQAIAQVQPQPLPPTTTVIE